MPYGAFGAWAYRINTDLRTPSHTRSTFSCPRTRVIAIFLLFPLILPVLFKFVSQVRASKYPASRHSYDCRPAGYARGSMIDA